jgi:GAF domain-containing protein
VEILVETVESELPFDTGHGVPLSDDIGDLTVEGNGIVAVTGGSETDSDGGFSSYIGAPVYVGERRYGTLCFCDRGDRTEFTGWERAFVELLGDWLGHELTSEWARDQSETVAAARNRLHSAIETLDDGDDDAVREELVAIAELLDREPPSTAPVSIELS